MTDFDVLARLRSLEAKLGTALDRIGQLERTAKRYRDAPEYKAQHEISDHEAYGAMIHAMRRTEGTENG